MFPVIHSLSRCQMASKWYLVAAKSYVACPSCSLCSSASKWDSVPATPAVRVLSLSPCCVSRESMAKPWHCLDCNRSLSALFVYWYTCVKWKAGNWIHIALSRLVNVHETLHDSYANQYITIVLCFNKWLNEWMDGFVNTCLIALPDSTSCPLQRIVQIFTTINRYFASAECCELSVNVCVVVCVSWILCHQWSCDLQILIYLTWQLI